LAPRVFIDADGVPVNPVLRGTVVQLRAHVTDGSAVTLTPSPGMTATRQIDGSYRLSVDTSALEPGTTTAQPILTATDIAGNRASASAQFPMTRVRWQVTPTAARVIGIAITPANVIASTSVATGGVLNRSDGSFATNVALGAAALGILATDGLSFFT